MKYPAMYHVHNRYFNSISYKKNKPLEKEEMKMQTTVIETENGNLTIREEYNEYFNGNAFGVDWESGEERHEWTVYDWDGDKVGSFESAEYAEEYILENY